MKSRIIILAVVMSLFTPRVLAHGVETVVTTTGKAVKVTSSYSPSEPLPGAAVAIYSPGSYEEVWQSGRTDISGTFVFIPTMEGDWVFIVDDEKGHRKKLTISVPAGLLAQAESGINIPVSGGNANPAIQGNLSKAIIGLSLIFGLTGIYYGIRSGKKS